MTSLQRRVLAVSFLLCAVAFSGVTSRVSVPAGAQRAGPQYLVIIVMDGFRPDYLSLAPMHHLHELMSSGTSYDRAWVGQLETETPTGHATIVTGVYPRKHNVIGFVWRDPTGDGVTWMPTDRQLLNAGDMEHLIEAAGVPSVSDVMHARYPGSTSVALSGEKVYAADAMGVGADYIVWGNSYAPNNGWIVPTPVGNHIPPASTRYQSLRVRWNGQPNGQDPFSTRLALRLFKTLHPRTLLVNLPSVDVEGHRDGGVTATGYMRQTVKGADNAIGQIMAAYKAAGIYDKTLFVVTADHGMIPNGRVVNRQAIYNAVGKTGVPSLEQDLLSSAGYIYLRYSSDTPRVETALARHTFKGVEGLLYRSSPSPDSAFVADPATAKRLGPALTRAYLDLSNTMDSAAGPDIVLPYGEDVIGDTVKGYGPHWGTHGGFSWRVQHIPLVISGPGVPHRLSHFPAQLVDIAPTIERLMGAQVSAGVDGVVLADATENASDADSQRQKAVQASRLPDVRALQARSARQHAIVLSNQ